jgi:hypothetical protein
MSTPCLQAIREKNKCVDALKRKIENLERSDVSLQKRTRAQLEQLEAAEKKRFEAVRSLLSSFAHDRIKVTRASCADHVSGQAFFNQRGSKPYQTNSLKQTLSNKLSQTNSLSEKLVFNPICVLATDCSPPPCL